MLDFHTFYLYSYLVYDHYFKYTVNKNVHCPIYKYSFILLYMVGIKKCHKLQENKFPCWTLAHSFFSSCSLTESILGKDKLSDKLAQK
jgi:hypothetical protein